MVNLDYGLLEMAPLGQPLGLSTTDYPRSPSSVFVFVSKNYREPSHPKASLTRPSDRYRHCQCTHTVHTPSIYRVVVIPVKLRAGFNAMPAPPFVESLLVVVWLRTGKPDRTHNLGG